VPGDTVLDLVRAGEIAEPYFGTNIFSLRKYEYYRWLYSKTVFVPDFSGKMLLSFGGINTFANVYVNDICVGSADNMLIEHSFDVTNALIKNAENKIDVVISSPILASREFDYPVALRASEHTEEYARLRMPPSAFGWDILCRCVSAGLWRGVRLIEQPQTHITQVYLATKNLNSDFGGTTAVLTCRYRFDTSDGELTGYRIHILGQCGDSRFEIDKPEFSTVDHQDITVPNPKLWWPAGYGEQNLYDVTFELIKDGVVLDSRHFRAGIRSAEVEFSDNETEPKQFLVKINNTPILCKGSNWVPLDALHSRDASQYESALELFRDMGCNILRCWGGNVYEDDRFFDLCDEYGILVWQDFSMACAIYPQDEDFCRRLEEEAVAVIRRVRNHACLLLWAGDNEVDEAYSNLNYNGASNRYNALTREVLPRAVRMNDPYRFYLPSSPYISPTSKRYSTPEQHNWGSRAYFKDDFYKHTTARFISECGYHGCPNKESLEKFIPENELWPITTGGSWDCHNTDDIIAHPRYFNRNHLMTEQVQVLCGFVPEGMDDYILVSQFSQAEALKFFVERTRIGKWHRTGVIWWNMRDGWPQISDAIVDWYGGKKLAYSFLKRVHTPVCLMLDEAENWKQKVILGNDSRQSHVVKWTLKDADTGELIASGENTSGANENVTVAMLHAVPGEKRLFLLNWTLEDGTRGFNHYLTGFPPYDIEDLKRWKNILCSAEN